MISGVEEGVAVADNNNTKSTNIEAAECAAASRKERRKAAKKEKRKNKRKEMAEMARREEEARLNDPEEQLRLEAEERKEKLRAEKERREFEERERNILEAWERKKALEEKEEEERRRAKEEEHRSKQNQVGHDNEIDEDAWEYVEEGPPEIIWQGNEIIVKKKRIRVKKKDADQQIVKEDPNRPTSNPLPPQSEVFADHKNASTLSAEQLLENVAQETPNFGTEQDKAHCPFHLKTGACRFGSHCSRIHFYPDKSCTLLIKNMYNGPGLAWEQDEGLENDLLNKEGAWYMARWGSNKMNIDRGVFVGVYMLYSVTTITQYTDEEVERSYEEFYEDVHTEFLKFGEIVNFKVCRNGSSHLRGNMYVHYKSLDSAVLSYQSVNGRYFAGKQLQCEFVGVTRWKVAICGEFMKSKLKTCSRGMACNFIHCFRNPGGDYEWADWDKPPPKYWQKRMAALFGYSYELVHDRKIERGSPRSFRNSRRTLTDDSERSQSRGIDCSKSSRNYGEDDARKSEPQWRHRSSDRKHSKDVNDKHYGESAKTREKRHRYSSIDCDSDRNRSDGKDGRRSSFGSSNLSPDNHHGHSWWSTRHREKNGHSTFAVEQRKKMSTSPDDRWNFRDATGDTDLAGNWSDGERQSAHISREESPRSDGSEEFEHRRSKRRCTPKLKVSKIRDHLDGEVEHDGESPSNSGRSYRNPGCTLKHYSRPVKQFHDDCPRRVQCHEAMRFLAENQTEEDTDLRGRWEPG